MKIQILLFLSLFTFGICAQESMTSAQWQGDLRFLQKTVHKDYDFLFKKVTKEVFDTEVEQLYKEIPSLENHEVIVGLARIVALFKYGHTSIHLGAWHQGEAFQFHQLPFQLMQFKDGVFVQGTKKDYENALGARVIRVEGMDIEKALAAVKPAFPSENDQFFKAYGLYFLGIPEILHAQKVTTSLQDKVTLTLEKDGRTFKQTYSAFAAEKFPGQYGFIKEEGDWLDARDNSTDPLYLKNLDKIYFYEYLPEEKTVYVRQSQIQDDPQEAIPEFYGKVFKFIKENDVEKLVLDVRLNGGGNNYKNKPVVTGIIKSEKINQPGHLFVIIGGRTFSACQNLVNELSNYTEAIFVGEPTGENINFYGDNRTVLLPNSQIPVRLSFAWWQDKPQWENGDWTAPHIAVDMNFEDYKTNKDPVLQTALDFSGEFILNPMQYLTDLYLSGNIEKLMSESERIIHDPQYKFFNFEEEFNKTGYNLLRDGQVEVAVTVFDFVVQFFPESANAWDSRAEGYWKAGQIEKAKEYYRKAISLDPEGPIGDNARKMLKEIEKKE
jgi:tetratricopeptide (TPR) repeat protein